MDTNQRWRQLESQIPRSNCCLPLLSRSAALPLIEHRAWTGCVEQSLSTPFSTFSGCRSKARSILECWCILMMRCRLEDERKKDEVYDLLLSGPPAKTTSAQLRLVGGDESEPDDVPDRVTAVIESDVVSTRHRSKSQREADKKQKARWKRGAVVLAHLLIDRAQHGGTSLLDTYLDEVYFPWSVATEQTLDSLLSSRVIGWIQEARTHFDKKRSKIDERGGSAVQCAAASCCR